jgi:hypothetical protein
MVVTVWFQWVYCEPYTRFFTINGYAVALFIRTIF